MITTGHDRARAAWWSGARAGFAVAVITALALLVAACGASDGGTSDPRDDRKTAAATADPVADLVGPGCADYAKAVPDGSGSFDGMASSPVASAARNNPLLSMLVKAFSGRLNPDVDLVDLLNGGEYTVFAPVDDAFDKLPADMLTAVSDEAGGATLSGILAHHVIPRRLAPADIDGTFMTINGDELRITGSGDDIMVDGQAAVVCGGIQTGNATVYLIDSVLMPPAGQ